MRRVLFVVTWPFYCAVGFACLWMLGQHIKKAAK
jgi:hypothetical protein